MQHIQELGPVSEDKQKTQKTPDWRWKREWGVFASFSFTLLALSKYDHVYFLGIREQEQSFIKKKQ